MNADTPPAPGRPHPAVPAPAPLWRRLAAPAGTLVAVAGAFGYVGAVDPNQPGHYPVCPLFALTGLYCPGCGGLRSAHAFVHGDLFGALRDNAFGVVAYVAFAVLWAVWVVRAARGKPLRIDVPTARLWVIGGALLAFTVVRNLPFGGWLHP
ncbi:DUF2752 domain-containing protein [Streptomyces sp. LaPpAH-108]|uniref:DUF2752 domain-containing protein n=1 Tax=Streptomyces sp. LaPpAH-108 TaxID=1155714 RepID=UPI0003A5DA6B